MNEDVVLVQPTADASDAQIHMRNNFATMGKNLADCAAQGMKESDVNTQVFRPKRFGQLSKNYHGTMHNALFNSMPTVDVHRIDYSDDGRKITVPK